MNDQIQSDGGPVENSAPLADTTDWKSRYHGASSTLGRIQKELDALKIKHADLFSELEALRAEYTNTTTSHANTLKEKEALLTQHQQELARLKKQEQTGGMIAKEYPSLLPLYLERLVNINGLTDEEIPVYLNNMAQKLNALHSEATYQSSLGTTPPSPKPVPSGETMTIEQIEEQLRAIRPDSPEFSRLMKLRMKLLRT